MSSLAILVVDDVEPLQQLVQHMLESAGHRVTCVSGGRAALRLLGSMRFDVLLTDILMPDCDGIEVMTTVKRHYPDTRIVAMSGGGTFMGTSTCLKVAGGLGADFALAKPFSREALLAAIAAVAAMTGEAATEG